MSCASATRAAVAIRHSNASDRYTTITIRNAISASSALREIWLPQLGPIDFTLTLLRAIENRLAIASWIWYWVFWFFSTGVWTLQPVPVRWTVIVVPAPAWATVLATCAGVWGAAEEKSKTSPPLKSMLKLT